MARGGTGRSRETTLHLAAAFLLGVGLGGSLDGIVFHQLLQWHHLVSEPYPPTTLANLELNTLADGLFQFSMWFVTVLGIVSLVAASRRSAAPTWREIAGGALAGWGGFDVVEGLVDHQLFGLHHVRPGPDHVAWDVGYLTFGAALVVFGWLLVRSNAR